MDRRKADSAYAVNVSLMNVVAQSVASIEAA